MLLKEDLAYISQHFDCVFFILSKFHWRNIFYSRDIVIGKIVWKLIRIL